MSLRGPNLRRIESKLRYRLHHRLPFGLWRDWDKSVHFLTLLESESGGDSALDTIKNSRSLLQFPFLKDS